MITMLENISKISPEKEINNLYQLQVEGLKKGWLIYLKMKLSNPPILIIRKKLTNKKVSRAVS